MADLRITEKELKNPELENLDECRDILDDIIIREEEQLIPVLQAVQEEFGFLPRNYLEYISKKINVSMAEIYGIITFYHSFYTMPRGDNIVRVCRGTACHVSGADKLVESLESKLNIECNETTDDNKFTLETVACVGCCSLAPVMVVGEETWARLNKDKVDEIIDQYDEDDDLI